MSIQFNPDSYHCCRSEEDEATCIICWEGFPMGGQCVSHLFNNRMVHTMHLECFNAYRATLGGANHCPCPCCRLLFIVPWVVKAPINPNVLRIQASVELRLGLVLSLVSIVIGLVFYQTVLKH